ncbi:hypothetical protein ACFSTC_32330 [Nonomuraea ferruginea]
MQVSAANTVTFTDSRFVNLGQTAIGIGNDANAHASGVGLGAARHHGHPVGDRPQLG